MRNKIIGGIGLIVVIMVAGFALVSKVDNDRGSKRGEEMRTEASISSEIMAKDKMAADEAMEKEKVMKENEAIAKGEVMPKPDVKCEPLDPVSANAICKTPVEAMAKSGNYITLADYNANSGKFAADKKVYFFHASWCPICQGVDREINADMSKIPSGVTLIKTDFDSQTDLRQKYGVTVQYTFVQVDQDGNSTNKFSATSFDKVVAGIK